MLPRVVNDTNVWLSALYFSGNPGQIVRLVEEKEIISVTSNPLLGELKRVMVTDFETPRILANGTVSYIRSISEVVRISGTADFGLRDPDDNKVIETALVGQCSRIVTGDKDLLTLNKYEEIKIVKPEQLLREIY